MTRLHLAFDGLTITARPAGVGSAAREILTGLLALPDGPRITATLPRGTSLSAAALGSDRLSVIEAPVDGPDTPRALLQQHVRLARRLAATRPDAYLGPAFVLPLHPVRAPMAVIVYDAAWRRFPATKTRRFRAYMDRVVPSSMRRAAAVITCSRFTAGECRELAPDLPNERLHVVPLGVPPRPATADPGSVLEELGIRRPYVLAVSNFDARKNLPRLIDAWRTLRDMFAFETTLVLVGHPERAALLRAEREVGPHERVVTPGYVSDSRLGALYAGAGLVVVPSLYEGFGFPVLEAYAAGAPVACAEAGSLPEVAGTAALLFDPTDVAGMAQAIAEGLRPSAARQHRVETGREIAANHSWESTASGVLDVLRAITRA